MQKLIQRLNKKSQLAPIVIIGTGAFIFAAGVYLFVEQSNFSGFKTNGFYDFFTYNWGKILIVLIIIPALFFIARDVMVKSKNPSIMGAGVGFALFPYFLIIAFIFVGWLVIPSIWNGIYLLFTAPGYDRPPYHQNVLPSVAPVPTPIPAKTVKNKNKRQGNF